MRGLIIPVVFAIWLASCQRDYASLEFLEVKTELPQELNVGAFRLVGRVSGLTQSSVDACGFVWSVSVDSINDDPRKLRTINPPLIPTRNDTFSIIYRAPQLENLYFRAFAQLGERLVFSNEIVSAGLGDVVQMTGTPEIDNDRARVFGKLTGLGHQTVDFYGHVYSAVDPSPEIGADSDTTQFSNGVGDPAFESMLQNLDFNTTYFVRAYIIDGQGAPIYSTEVQQFRVRDGWKRIGDFPDDFVDGAAVTDANGQAFVGFGINNSSGPANEILRKFWSFNPAGDGSWPELASFSDNPFDKRTNTSIFAIGDTIYVIFGEKNNPNTTAVRNFWKYSISQNKWVYSFIDDPNNQFLARSGAAGFILNGKIYAGAGRYYRPVPESPVYLNDFWEYNPQSGIWRKVKSLPMKTSFSDSTMLGRYDATGFSSGTFGYVGCGDYAGIPVRDVWRFTPPVGVQDSGKWELLPDPFPGVGRIDALQFVIGGKAYFGTGWNITERNVADFYEFDFLTEKWTKRTAFQGGPRRKMIGFAAGGFGYAGTGIENIVTLNGQGLAFEPRKDIWRYTPEH